MPITTDHHYDIDTTSTRVGDHDYALQLSDRWNSLGGHPNGGYVLAACLRALRQEFPQPDLLSASAHYLRPSMPGPARIRTEVARIGRRTGTGQSTLSQNDKEILRVLATFTDLDGMLGRTEMLGAAPALPAPEECVDPMSGMRIPGVTIADQVEFRMPTVPGYWTGSPGGTAAAEFWMRFAYERVADPISLALFVDAAAPVVLDLGVPGSVTLELTVHIRNRPAPGWLACRAATKYLTNGIHEEDFEIWDSTGTLVAQSRQLALIP